MEPQQQYTSDIKYRAIFAFSLALLLFVSIAFDQCHRRDKIESKLQSVELSNKALRKKVMEDSSVIYTQDIMLLEEEVSRAVLKAQADSLKMENIRLYQRLNVRSVYRGSVNLGKPTVVTNDVPCDTLPSGHYLSLPKSFAKSDRWSILSGHIDTTGNLVIDSLVMPAKIQYAIGDTLKQGFFNRLFKRKDKVVRIRVDNPNIIIDNGTVVISEDKKRKGVIASHLAVFSGGILVGLFAR